MTAFTEHSVAPTLCQSSDRARRLLSLGATSPPSLAFGRWEGGRDILPHLLGLEKTHLSGREERGCLRGMLSKRNPSWGLGARPRGGGWSSGLGCGSPGSGPGSTPNHRGTSVSLVTNKKIEFIGEAKCFGFDIEKERAFQDICSV